MMIHIRKSVAFLLVTSSSILSSFLVKGECPTVETVENFDIEVYACKSSATNGKVFSTDT